MDPHNADRFVGEDVEKYWGQVDLYMGGAEHATGHLLYSRFWYLFLKDLGLVTANEPFQKLINQGMILGRSNFVYRANLSFVNHPQPGHSIEIAPDKLPQLFITASLADAILKGSDVAKKQAALDKVFDYYDEKISNFLSAYRYISIEKTTPEDFTITPLHVDVNIAENEVLDVNAFKNWREEYSNAEFILEENGTYVCGVEVEKMSKSKYNVVNPDVLIDKYGADALRLYEMFLGPLEQFKPWNTNGISGVATFLKKFWRLFHPEDGALAVTDEPASPAELKTLHRVIQKVAQDVEKFSFNTSVSTFMIAVNELTALGTRKRAILEPLVVLLSPFAPHLTERLWLEVKHGENAKEENYPGFTISYEPYPEFREEYLVEANVTYPVAINGKVREQRQFAATATAAEIEAAILESDFLTRFGDGKAVKKVVVVPGRMVNVVV
jgi:leucyl-tRNA synthetase